MWGFCSLYISNVPKYKERLKVLIFQEPLWDVKHTLMQITFGPITVTFKMV